MTEKRTCDTCGDEIPDDSSNPFMCEACDCEYCDLCGEPLDDGQIGQCDECYDG